MTHPIPVVAPDCSRCADYQLVDGPDGLLVRCPDCLGDAVSRCPVHGRGLRAGRCPMCGREARLAEDMIVARSRPGGHPLRAAA